MKLKQCWFNLSHRKRGAIKLWFCSTDNLLGLNETISSKVSAETLRDEVKIFWKYACAVLIMSLNIRENMTIIVLYRNNLISFPPNRGFFDGNNLYYYRIHPTIIPSICFQSISSSNSHSSNWVISFYSCKSTSEVLSVTWSLCIMQIVFQLLNLSLHIAKVGWVPTRHMIL